MAAHLGALGGGRPTVVFAGTAVDCTQGPAQRRLLRGVLWAGGAWVSEHPPGAATCGYHLDIQIGTAK